MGNITHAKNYVKTFFALLNQLYLKLKYQHTFASPGNTLINIDNLIHSFMQICLNKIYNCGISQFGHELSGTI